MIQTMVGEQGEMLQKAEDNVTQADVLVEAAVQDIEIASDEKSSYRRKILCVVVVLLAIIVAVVLILLFHFKVI